MFLVFAWSHGYYGAQVCAQCVMISRNFCPLFLIAPVWSCWNVVLIVCHLSVVLHIFIDLISYLYAWFSRKFNHFFAFEQLQLITGATRNLFALIFLGLEFSDSQALLEVVFLTIFVRFFGFVVSFAYLVNNIIDGAALCACVCDIFGLRSDSPLLRWSDMLLVARISGSRDFVAFFGLSLRVYFYVIKTSE